MNTLGGVFFDPSATYRAAIGPKALPLTLTTPGFVPSLLDLDTPILDVVSSSPRSNLAGKSYTIVNADAGSLIQGGFGELTSSNGINYTVDYTNPSQIVINVSSGHAWSGFLGPNPTFNEIKMASYLDYLSKYNPSYLENPVFLALDRLEGTEAYNAALNVLQTSRVGVTGTTAFNAPLASVFSLNSLMEPTSQPTSIRKPVMALTSAKHSSAQASSSNPLALSFLS